MYWSGDYVGHYDYRVSYRQYVDTYMHARKPAFQEDRFRIRERGQFQPKDYTPEMTVRGLWHSTMAGGVANIWGNLLPHSDNELGSEPYDNLESGTIRGVNVTVAIKDKIQTYSTFWFDKERFSADLIRDNDLSGNRPGRPALSETRPSPISVSLRNSRHTRYIFYAEAADSIRMNLSNSASALPAVAIDIHRPYKEIDLGPLEAAKINWKAPYASTWAIAVGEF